jgi:putative transposase
MLGFKSVSIARVILGGVEMITWMHKDQAKYALHPQPSPADQVHLLAA